MWSITSMLFLALVMISNGPHTHYTTHWQPTKKGNKRLYGEPPLFADSTKGLNKSFVERTAFVCWMETPFEKLTKRLERCNSSPASSIDERGLHLFKTFIFFCYNRPLWYAQQKLLQYSSLLLQKIKWWEPQPAKITRRNQLSQRKLKASAIFFSNVFVFTLRRIQLGSPNLQIANSWSFKLSAWLDAATVSQFTGFSRLILLCCQIKGRERATVRPTWHKAAIESAQCEISIT